MSSRFQQLISGSGAAEIRARRGARLESQTKNTYQSLINKLQDAVIKTTDRRQEILDFGPDHTTSLRAAENFNPASFVNEYHSLGVALVKQKEELAVAVADFTELFGEEPQLYTGTVDVAQAIDNAADLTE